MKKAFLCAVGAALVSAAMATPASAAMVIGGGWNPFSFGGVGSHFGPVTFTITQAARLKVTDAFLDGDQFRLWINSVGVGNTSTPVNDGTQVGSDYDAAFASAKFSHGIYELMAGSYTVTGQVVLSPYGGGGAAMELISAPEPAAWALMIGGFGLLGLALRRKRNAGSLALTYS